jgi:ParB-like chromosome segregation protein Spo0J
MIKIMENKETQLQLKLRNLIQELNALELNEKVNWLNIIRTELHNNSPFKNEPVDLVLWVHNTSVQANDYNPNSVAPPEMELLKLSILEDGYTQPIVTYDEKVNRTVVDGFHRNRVGKESNEVKQRVHGFLPVVTINENRTDKSDRIASTIRHNRARGKHKVDAMSEIVIDLKKRGWNDEKIAKKLGMDADEILRLAQISGLAEMFVDYEFSQAWEVDVIDENDDLNEINENIQHPI